jgi:tetratricopeptide (TPR) repeat protein
LAKAFLGYNSDAISDLDQAIALNPLYSQAWYSRGYWKDVNGDYEGAMADYKKVVELDPKNWDVFIAMATARHLKGDHEGSCEDIRKAIDLGSLLAEELKEKFCK